MKHRNLADAKKFWQLPAHQLREKLGNIDILHANNFFCPPKLPETRIVYTLYDLSFLEYPECTTEHNRIACFDGVFRASLNADFIIAISHFTRTHFLQIFPHFPAERIVVANLASRFIEKTVVAQPKKLNHIKAQQFWLNIGTIEPRKNIRRLLNAYAKLRQLQPNTYPLVLAGKQGWLTDDFEQLIESLGLKQHVFVLGYVNDEELQWLCQECFCLVYPSLFEGFGLPLLEAMQFGAPVITSNSSSIPEVVGNAGILIDPLNEEEIIHAMQDIASHPAHREKLKVLATQQAQLFSWKNTAKIILNCYHEAMTLPKRYHASQIGASTI